MSSFSQALIGLHTWATSESLEVLGVFGTVSINPHHLSLTADIDAVLEDGSTAISSSRISHPLSNTRGYTGELTPRWRPVRRGLMQVERYLNNPDVMNGAGYLGLSFISGNKLVFIITVIKHLSQWWFLRNVER